MEDTWRDIIVPILKVRNTSLVAISTLDDKESNIFNRLTECTTIFEVIKTMYVCGPCYSKGIRKICIHNIDSRPSWITDDNDDVIDAVFGDGDKERLERETLGVATTISPKCFAPHHVAAMFSAPRIKLNDATARFLFTTVDPVGGSEIPDKRTSDFVIKSVANVGHFAICGLDALEVVRQKDYEEILLNHLRALRKIPCFEGATIILDVESGTGLEADHIQQLVLDNIDNVICINDKTHKPGTITTNKMKEEAMLLTRSMLEAGEIRFAEKIVTSSKNPDKLLAEMKEQMLEYQRYVIPSVSLRQPNSVVYSGKGPSKNKRDDMCFTLQRAVRLWHRFTFDAAFQRYH